MNPFAIYVIAAAVTTVIAVFFAAIDNKPFEFDDALLCLIAGIMWPVVLLAAGVVVIAVIAVTPFYLLGNLFEMLTDKYRGN
jgi:hypothetical protein